MFRALLFVCCLASFSAMAGDGAQLGELVNQRLAYMKDVAGYKAQQHLPIEDLARAQRVRPVHDPGELGDDIWESDDELAEFLADLRVIRTLALG